MTNILQWFTMPLMIKSSQQNMDILTEHKQNLVREEIRSVKAGLKNKIKLLEQTKKAIYQSLLDLDNLEHVEKSLTVSNTQEIL